MEEEEKASLASCGSRNGQVYFINGIKVPFPAKAYPTQITMMHKILRGLDRMQNCLLESPTGSGKTLALLCSSLAWQRSEKDKLKNQIILDREKLLQQLEEKDADESKCFNAKKEIQTLDVSKKAADLKMDMQVAASNKLVDHKRINEIKDAEEDIDNEEDLDFQTAKKRFRTPTGGLPSAKKHKKSAESLNEPCGSDTALEDRPKHPNWKMELTTDGLGVTEQEQMLADEKASKILNECSDKPMVKKENPRIPKIYFGTRTHKQIAQIVRELKKTAFKTSRMTILSSREHSCIHPIVSNGKDKNEECRRLVKGIDGKSCRYHGNAAFLSKPIFMEKYHLDTVWDIEDLVKAGKKAKACPYYAAREMMDDADIIFCPYNYLVDPQIRSQMNINLKDEVVVLDEAHNIEDSAREAASIVVTSTQLEETMDELNKMILFRIMPDAHRSMHTLCSIILQWLESLSDLLTRTGFETAVKIFKGEEMVERMQLIEITSSSLPVYKNEYSKISSTESEADYITDIDAPKLSTKAISVLHELIAALERVLDKSQKFIADFKIAVSRKVGKQKRIHDMGGGWKTARNQVSTKSWEFSLNFWCLNPAVVFSAMISARCIVLTSGTLSPMSSFSSELGVSFPIQLEANHVIPDTQAWVGALTVGPDNKNIIANFQSSETFAFQDGVGKIILRVCETVPHGVLCFLASYSMLDKLKKRWMSTGLWQDISKTKVILSEPRGSDRSALDEIMHEFYGAAQSSTSDDWPLSTNGALLLAVCRGKVSEGLDFSDNNARAVITIGIPFPDFKDTQVDLKRKYNNKHCASRGLLNGSEWYEIQAYRALNQALGRCIRHKRDWGAILLVDERFGRSPKYKNGLSKWVRGRCKTYSNFQNCVASIAAFAEARTLDPCPEPIQTSSTSSIQTPATFEKNATIASGTSCQDIKGSSTIVRPDGPITPVIKREQAPQIRDLNAEFKVEESTSKIVGITRSMLVENTANLSPEKATANNKMPENVLKPMKDEIDASIVEQRPSIKRNPSNSILINEESSKDCPSGLAICDDLEALLDVKTEFGKQKLIPSSKFSGNAMDFKSSTPRYSNFENLLKPVLESSQTRTVPGFNTKSGRVKLFKTTNLCCTQTSVKHKHSAGGKFDVGNKDPCPLEASNALVDLDFENDGFLENLTDQEFSQINFDDVAGINIDATGKDSKSPKTLMVSASTGRAVREDSPALFSIPSEDDGIEDGMETGNKCSDVIKGTCKASTIKPGNVTNGLGGEEIVASCRGKRSAKKKMDGDFVYEVPRSQLSSHKDAGENARKKRKDRRKQSEEEGVKERRENDKADLSTENVRLDEEDPVKNETPKVSRKKTTSRSNLRMTSGRRTELVTMDDKVCTRAEDSEISKAIFQRIVSCRVCNAVFAKTDDLQHTKVKSTAFSKLIGSSSKSVQIVGISLEKLKNFRKEFDKSECHCFTSGLKLNAIFSEEDSMVFTPLFCEPCYRKRKSKKTLIGFRILRILSSIAAKAQSNSDNGDLDVWLIPNKVNIESEK